MFTWENCGHKCFSLPGKLVHANEPTFVKNELKCTATGEGCKFLENNVKQNQQILLNCTISCVFRNPAFLHMRKNKDPDQLRILK